ncbi:bacteriorhodopsin [Aeromicrobium sp.]|nr:bacteriorhodopsin [Candidatus Saccharibacteria bacterium]
MDSANVWLWFGLIGMLVGSFVIFVMTQLLRKEDQHHGYVALSITLIAATAYYALATHLGDFSFNGKTVQVARYADWVITTPLLLLGLLAVGLPTVLKLKNLNYRLGLILAILGLDIYMILTGFLAVLANSNNSYVWYAVSCGAFLAITLLLFSEVRNLSLHNGGKKVAALYMRLTYFLTVVWIFYPVVWFLGNDGTSTISYTTENALYAILDVTAKVGFGLLTISGILSLQRDIKPASGESTIDAAASRQ